MLSHFVFFLFCRCFSVNTCFGLVSGQISTATTTRTRSPHRTKDILQASDVKARPSRTSALLRHPAMRKHLAHSMGVSEQASEAELKEMLDEKLESIIGGSGTGSGRSFCRSTSNLLHDHHDNQHSRTYRTGSLSDGLDDEPLSSRSVQSTHSYATNSAQSWRRDRQGRVSSRFKIPSFSDFRKRNQAAKKSTMSSSIELYNREPINEESELVSVQSQDGSNTVPQGSSTAPEGSNTVPQGSISVPQAKSHGASVTSIHVAGVTRQDSNPSHFTDTYCECNDVTASSQPDSPSSIDCCSRCGRLQRKLMLGLGTLPFDSKLVSSEQLDVHAAHSEAVDVTETDTFDVNSDLGAIHTTGLVAGRKNKRRETDLEVRLHIVLLITILCF